MTNRAEMKYFLKKDGVETGPFEKSILRTWAEAGALSSDQLYREDGSAEWLPINHLMAVLGVPKNMLQQADDAPAHRAHSGCLTLCLGILGLLCCLPLGAVALYFGGKASVYFEQNKRREGEQAEGTSLIFSIVAIVLGFIAAIILS